MSGSSQTQQSTGSGSYTNNGTSNYGSNSTFGQNVANQDALNQLYNNAGSLYSSMSPQYQTQAGTVADQQGQAANTANYANNSNMHGGVYGNLGIGNSLMQSLNGSLNAPSASQSLYSQIMAGNGGGDVANSLNNTLAAQNNTANQTVLANDNAQAAGSGMSGSSRQGVADALGQQFNNQNLAQNQAQNSYNAYCNQ